MANIPKYQLGPIPNAEGGRYRQSDAVVNINAQGQRALLQGMNQVAQASAGVAVDMRQVQNLRDENELTSAWLDYEKTATEKYNELSQLQGENARGVTQAFNDFSRKELLNVKGKLRTEQMRRAFDFKAQPWNLQRNSSLTKYENDQEIKVWADNVKIQMEDAQRQFSENINNPELKNQALHGFEALLQQFGSRMGMSEEGMRKSREQFVSNGAMSAINTAFNDGNLGEAKRLAKGYGDVLGAETVSKINKSIRAEEERLEAKARARRDRAAQELLLEIDNVVAQVELTKDTTPLKGIEAQLRAAGADKHADKIADAVYAYDMGFKVAADLEEAPFWEQSEILNTKMEDLNDRASLGEINNLSTDKKVLEVAGVQLEKGLKAAKADPLAAASAKHGIVWDNNWGVDTIENGATVTEYEFGGSAGTGPLPPDTVEKWKKLYAQSMEEKRDGEYFTDLQRRSGQHVGAVLKQLGFNEGQIPAIENYMAYKTPANLEIMRAINFGTTVTAPANSALTPTAIKNASSVKDYYDVEAALAENYPLIYGEEINKKRKALNNYMQTTGSTAILDSLPNERAIEHKDVLAYMPFDLERADRRRIIQKLSEIKAEHKESGVDLIVGIREAQGAPLGRKAAERQYENCQFLYDEAQDVFKLVNPATQAVVRDKNRLPVTVPVKDILMRDPAERLPSEQLKNNPYAQWAGIYE